MSRYRVTVRGKFIELRGYCTDLVAVSAIAKEVESLGVMVVVSPAADDFDPFEGAASAHDS